MKVKLIITNKFVFYGNQWPEGSGMNQREVTATGVVTCKARTPRSNVENMYSQREGIFLYCLPVLVQLIHIQSVRHVLV